MFPDSDVIVNLKQPMRFKKAVNKIERRTKCDGLFRVFSSYRNNEILDFGLTDDLVLEVEYRPGKGETSTKVTFVSIETLSESGVKVNRKVLRTFKKTDSGWEFESRVTSTHILEVGY